MDEAAARATREQGLHQGDFMAYASGWHALRAGSGILQASDREAIATELEGRLADLLEPKWLRIGGYWYPRGGIPIDVFWQTGAPPEGLWLPDQGVPTYRGRG
jgi:hypothetical protein